jgi:hypothetical protein
MNWIAIKNLNGRGLFNFIKFSTENSFAMGECKVNHIISMITWLYVILWFILKYYPDICQKRLNKTAKIIHSDCSCNFLQEPFKCDSYQRANYQYSISPKFNLQNSFLVKCTPLGVILLYLTIYSILWCTLRSHAINLSEPFNRDSIFLHS